ncbi:MAG: AAA family ATPase, partial [Candidatus Latescibacteria bacterium]|nr:AAA family ATPase [Candidatus Latescibacterota bacterium]
SDVEKVVTDIEHRRGISFAPMQREAIIQSATANMMILTGGPGTGKTTTVLGIIDIFRRLKLSVLLCAPTGRAAKRLSETTGMEAKTIHRLLEYNPMNGNFTRNEGSPLGAHAVIMDEASMVDTRLMKDFLRAISPYTILIIVGDVDQLPSIGPGNVLRDMIQAGIIPTVRLTEIFRQAASSKIVRCAHLINSGKMPFADNDHESNFFFIRMTEPSKISSTIVDMVARRLPGRYGFDPVEDIQVLSPMHKGETGVVNLNALLQERLNPFRKSFPEIRYGNWVYREGDRVMQIRNNYDRMVFNGDIGRIEKIIPAMGIIRVCFDEPVEYSVSELDELVPAYAISVHKSQGSEFRCTVMPVTTQHYIMLKRNLLYTAVTRARELAVMVGDTKALAIAVGNDQVSERYTSLEERLKS